MMRLLIAFIAAWLSLSPMPAQSNSDKQFSRDQTLISACLSTLHDAASKADGDRYFKLFTADAVFLGTDATERWPIDEFKAYAMKRFATGTGWTYTLHENSRHITIANDIAWFDELLDNAKYGHCRGTG